MQKDIHHIKLDSGMRLRLYRLNLRTVPTIVIAHTFCASRDTRISYGCLLIQGYFCAVQNYVEKAELSK